jgi:regulator of protease activity HflC (stomatin/prohibitin superfamily)
MNFAWLSELLQSFSQILPRPILILSNQWGVHFPLGLSPRIVGPRPLIYLPLIESVEILPQHQLTVELGEQTLTTADSHQITICGSLLFRITDPVICFVECGQHYEVVAAYHARAVYQTAITACDVVQLQELDESKSHDEIAERLLEIGIELIECKLIEASKSRTIKHYGIQS